MLLDPEGVQAVALGAAAVALVSLLLCLALLVRLARLRRAYDRLVAGDEHLSFVQAVTRSTATAQAVRGDVGMLRDDLARTRADLSTALRHVGVVRYDAFGDLGGRLSFSAALLDDAGSGLVLTSIAARSETRTYAKGVQARTSEHALSPEETEAIERATRPR